MPAGVADAARVLQYSLTKNIKSPPVYRGAFLFTDQFNYCFTFSGSCTLNCIGSTGAMGGGGGTGFIAGWFFTIFGAINVTVGGGGGGFGDSKLIGVGVGGTRGTSTVGTCGGGGATGTSTIKTGGGGGGGGATTLISCANSFSDKRPKPSSRAIFFIN